MLTIDGNIAIYFFEKAVYLPHQIYKQHDEESKPRLSHI